MISMMLIFLIAIKLRLHLFLNNSLSLFYPGPRKRVHLFHPFFNLFIITRLYVLLNDISFLFEYFKNSFWSGSRYSGKIQILSKGKRIINS